MSIRQLLMVLRLRWWLVILMFSLVLGAGWAFAVYMPKQYTAETTVLLDTRVDPLLATLMPTLASPGYIATQIEMIRSDRVADRVVRALDLGKHPEVLKTWQEATQGRIPLEAYFGGLLQKGLEVEPVRGSNLMSIKFTGQDPKFTASVANAFAQTYIDLSVELRVEPARQSNSFFDDRIKGLRAEYEAAQAKLSAYQQKNRIVATDERVDLETARLTATMTQLTAAQAEMADTASRSRNTGTETSPDVQQSGVVQGLKSELARAEARLSEISSVVGTSHPQRIELDTRIAVLKQQLAAEMRRVSGATATVNRVAGQKIGELAAMAETQKRVILGLRAQRDEMSILQKDVDTAQRAFEAVAQRRSQLSLESQSSQAAARVLSPALEPIMHSKPNVPKYVVTAAIFGLLLGLASAVGWELLDRRVRSESDMFTAAGVPLLGVLSPRPGESWRAPRGPRGPLVLGAPASVSVPRLTLDGQN